MPTAVAAADDPLAWVAVAACLVTLVPAGLRWLRVSQREHYLAGSATRFARRWWTSEPADLLLAVLALAGLGLSVVWPLTALATAVAVALGPLHLSPRGRTSPLVWTTRLRTLGGVWVLLQAVVVVAGVLAGVAAPLAAAGAVVVPLLVDLAAWVLGPVERRRVAPFVAQAAERLRKVGPTVVAVTGSYGKTSTKHHIAHLLTGTKHVVASPASFNNRAGLARAVNEHLSEGAEVFVAEMGTYGRGEIAELCSWCRPDISVITAIGPVHLERFGSEDEILAAKTEITENVGVVVLNVDDDRLAGLADRLDGEGRTVLRCSGWDHEADVCVTMGESEVAIWGNGRSLVERAAIASGIQPTNLACAVAVALRLGLPEDRLAVRLADLPGVPNRLSQGTTPRGVVVLDDTFNANPAGASAALEALRRLPAGRRVVVTPGMVELGALQAVDNRRFAEAAAGVATDLLVVGRTNRRALLEGARSLQPIAVRTREEAVSWVRGHLEAGDAVLYENDLPDHYP
ncbi:MAG TPA: UDP-N-acetylmuramoyl-tripeptide--D-alanyl-D-alanine ligase [Acidimicrobiales bacterium]|nr:UDP-N-acetylmuramoyl-tripeptide--D-alanyl-D-alanine ligase [Acidimicrobiales bacterium]